MRINYVTMCAYVINVVEDSKVTKVFKINFNSKKVRKYMFNSF